MRSLVRRKLADEAEPHRAAIVARWLGRAVDFDAEMAEAQWRGKTIALIGALQKEGRRDGLAIDLHRAAQNTGPQDDIVRSKGADGEGLSLGAAEPGELA